MAKVRWGLIGATVIGREWMIDAIRQAGGDIVAVMSTDPARGRAYADEFGIPQSVAGLPGLFSAGVEAVYISTTNERHPAETIAAAKAGVHVLAKSRSQPALRTRATWSLLAGWRRCEIPPHLSLPPRSAPASLSRRDQRRHPCVQHALQAQPP